MKQFSKTWVASYYESIMNCVDRYKSMTDDADLVEFLAEFNRDVPLLKLDRWLGYVQGVLIERKVTTVQTERDWTRRQFRWLDFCSGHDFDVGDYVIVNDGMGEMNFGPVIEPGATRYIVNCRFGGMRSITANDVKRISTPVEADQYHYDRSNGNTDPLVFDNGEVYQPPQSG